MKFDGGTRRSLLLILLGLGGAGGLAWFGTLEAYAIGERYLSYLIVVLVGSVAVFPAGNLIGKYLEEKEPDDYRGRGIEQAGRLIGQLERTLVLVFYLGRSLEGIAFLVIAKSIYRFGDLRKGHDPKVDGGREHPDEITFSISEYIILGSLLSYTVAILSGVYIDFLFDLAGYSLF